MLLRLLPLVKLNELHNLALSRIRKLFVDVVSKSILKKRTRFSCGFAVTCAISGIVVIVKD